mmetsp:Transcript_46970/g.89674  ORF Transcript_46970/g.89674 Transcript_46970/m.89674 type:complete len:235 (-) Transcript_46970:8-712(-)
MASWATCTFLGTTTPRNPGDLRLCAFMKSGMLRTQFVPLMEEMFKDASCGFRLHADLAQSSQTVGVEGTAMVVAAVMIEAVTGAGVDAIATMIATTIAIATTIVIATTTAAVLHPGVTGTTVETTIVVETVTVTSAPGMTAGPGLAHRRLHAQRNHQDDLPCPTLSRPLQQEGLHRLLEDLEHMCRCTTSGYKIVVHLHMPQCILRPTSMDLFGCSLLVCSALVYCNETSLCFD